MQEPHGFLVKCSVCGEMIKDMLEDEAFEPHGENTTCRSCTQGQLPRSSKARPNLMSLSHLDLPLGFTKCSQHPSAAQTSGYTYCLDCEEVHCSLCVLSSAHRFHEILPYVVAESVAMSHKTNLLARLKKQLPVYSSVSPGVGSVVDRLSNYLTRELDSIQSSLTKILPKLMDQLNSWQSRAASAESHNLNSLRDSNRDWVLLRDTIGKADNLELLQLTLGKLGDKSKALGLEDVRREHLAMRPPLASLATEIEQRHVATLKNIKEECKKNKQLSIRIDFSRVIQAINELRLEVIEGRDPQSEGSNKENVDTNAGTKPAGCSPFKKVPASNTLPQPIVSKTVPRNKLAKEIAVLSARPLIEKNKKSCFLIDVLESRHAPSSHSKTAIGMGKSQPKSLTKRAQDKPRQAKTPKSRSPMIGRFNPWEDNSKMPSPKQGGKLMSPIIGQRRLSLVDRQIGTGQLPFYFGKLGSMLTDEPKTQTQSSKAKPDIENTIAEVAKQMP